MNEALQQRFIGVFEVAGGSALVTIPFWTKALDQIVMGAHAVSAICGAVIAIWGVVRLVRSKK